MQRRSRRSAGFALLLLTGSLGLIGTPGCLALVDYKQPCNQTYDCDSGKRCDPVSSTCEDPLPCASNADCGVYRCNGGTCFFSCDTLDGTDLGQNPHCASTASCYYDSTCK